MEEDNLITSFLNKYIIRKQFIIPVIISGLLWYFLFVFQPYFFNDLPLGEKISAVSLFVLSYLLPSLSCEFLYQKISSKSRTNKVILILFSRFSVIVITGIFSAIFLSILFQIFRFQFYIKMQHHSFFILFIPETVIAIYRYFLGFSSLSNNIKPEELTTVDSAKNPIIKIETDNNKIIEINTEILLFIRAEDNYSSIYYFDNLSQKNISKKLERISISEIEKQIGNHKNLILCHRSYIINLKYTDSITGNLKGYKAIIAGYEEPIPVSRDKGKSIQVQLDTYKRENDTAKSAIHQ